MKASNTFKWFLPYWKKHNINFIIIISLTFITIGLETLFPLFLKFIFDKLATSFEVNYMTKLIAALFAFMLVRAFASHILPFLRGLANMTFAGEIRDDVYKIYTNSSPEFFRRFATGDLITRLTNDIDGSWETLHWYYCSGVMRPLEAFLSVFGALIVMFSNSIPLTITSFIPIPILIGILAYFEVKMLRITLEKQTAASKCNDLLDSCFSGIKVVKSTISGSYQLNEYSKLIEERIIKEKDFLKINQLMQFLSSISSNSGVIITIFFGSYLLTKEQISLGSFIMFIIYLSRMVHHIWTISWFYATTKQMQKYQERIDETKSFESYSKGDKRISSFDNLSVQSISYQFPDANYPIINDFNLNLKKGEKVAIVGTIGSGKTTLIKLLSGQLQPTKGKILINNTAINDILDQDLFKLIGKIDQEAFLFSDTIKNNLTLGNYFDDDQVHNALECATLSNELKNFPDKENTYLGQKGASLSGGQKQRLSIARTLLRNPELILMDDITSAMDANTEELFWDRVKQMYPNTTMIIITHRQKTALRADRVVTL